MVAALPTEAARAPWAIPREYMIESHAKADAYMEAHRVAGLMLWENLHSIVHSLRTYQHLNANIEKSSIV